jgi:tocopherol cyclase
MLYPGFLRKIYNPPEFQGNLKSRNYFEGWYLKHVSADLKHSVSFIPGISLSKDPHSFIQILNGLTGDSLYLRYNLKDFSFESGKFAIRIGESFFSDHFSEINILTEEINVKGKIEYTNRQPYPQTFINPGVMGWYSFVPFMECKHGVVSMSHKLSGGLKMNGHKIDFNDGKGYIEKDWGTSFPESWIWIQCNHFDRDDVSFMFSVAKIPWMGKYFIGFLSFLLNGDQFCRFANYNRSRITHLEKTDNKLEIDFTNKNFTIHTNIRINQFSDLKAPRLGMMDRYMKESIDSDIEIVMKDRNENNILKLNGRKAGLEITGDINNLKEIIVE